MARTTPKPEEVFTPRAAAINKDMYVKRPVLEARLKQALEGQKNIILFGESGNGKTWLYKNVFEEEKIEFTIINLAAANMSGDLNSVFMEKLAQAGKIGEAEIEETWQGGFRPSGIGVEHTQKKKYRVEPKAPLEQLFSVLRERAGNRTAVLVYDNFEQILGSDNILRQIAGSLVMVDDDKLSKYNVKILIVGVPSDMKGMIAKTSNSVTISNRIIEIPEVARLTPEQSASLMQRGFVGKLRQRFAVDKESLFSRISWQTDRIAQHIHELCLCISRLAVKDNNTITQETVDNAEQEWLSESLKSDYNTIELLMNARETKAGRKNQVLFALGACDDEDFRNVDIERLVRQEFPEDTKGVSLNVGGILAEFASASNPIVRRTPKGDAFRFVSPKYRICLRTMLRKTETGKVARVRA